MEKDICAKEFFSDGARYADIINGLGCGGRQAVTEDDLQEMDSQTGIFRLRGPAKKTGRKRKNTQYRDLLRRTAFGMNFAVIGIENQEELDYALPLRIMRYDVLEYTAQAAAVYKKLRRQKRGLRSGEYMYGFAQDSRLHPVITFVLYFGEKEWDGAKDLHSIIDFTGIPEELRGMVQDYRIHLVEVRKLEDTSVFKTDVRQVFDFIRCSADPGKLEQLVASDAAYQDMDEDAYDMAAQYSRAAENMMQVKDYYKQGGQVNMADAITELRRMSKEEGIEQGLARGRAQGIEQGLARGRAQGIEQGLARGRAENARETARTMLKKGYADEEILDILKMDKAELDRIREEMMEMV
jgi:hypothetical protein